MMLTTGMDERLAKVAEVLAEHDLSSEGRNLGQYRTEWTCRCGDTFVTDGHNGPVLLDVWNAHQAAALAPLLDEFRAEDEARAIGPRWTASIGMQGRPNQGASFPADWPEHNPHCAALAEEGGDRG